MHPAGCFGSSLAFSDKSAACVACPAQADCRKLVDARRPTLLKLLSKFSDRQGDTMAHHWLTPKEKKFIREKRKQLSAPPAPPSEEQQVRDTIVSMLTAQPRTITQLVEGVALQCSLTRANADRKTKQQIAALSAHKRLKSTSKTIELA